MEFSSPAARAPWTVAAFNTALTVIGAGASASPRKRRPRMTERCKFGAASRLMPGSASGDLRIEVDGLGLPLLIKGAILSRHRQRVACLDSLQHALCLRLLRRIGRRIDELRRLQERSVGFEFEAHPRDIWICVGGGGRP